MEIPDPPNGARIVTAPHKVTGKLRLYSLESDGESWRQLREGITGEITIDNPCTYAEEIPAPEGREW